MYRAEALGKVQQGLSGDQDQPSSTPESKNSGKCHVEKSNSTDLACQAFRHSDYLDIANAPRVPTVRQYRQDNLE